MKSIKCAAIAVLLSSSFITPAFATPVTPNITQASDTSPVTQSEMETYCAAQHPETNYDGVNDRFTVDADEPVVGTSTAVAGTDNNINYRADTTVSTAWSYVGFIGTSGQLTRNGGSPNLWALATFNHTEWNNTLYDVETNFAHTVGYSWTCNYDQLQVVDHEWEWDTANVPSECDEPTYPGTDSCSITVDVPNTNSGGQGDNGCGAGGEATQDDQYAGGSDHVCGTTGGGGSGGQGGGGSGGQGGGGSGGHGGGQGGGGGSSSGDSGCGAGGEATQDETYAGQSDHVCGENGNSGGNGGGGTHPETTTYTGHWNPVYDWVPVGTATGSATHNIADGTYTTQTDVALAGHYGSVDYYRGGQVTSDVRILSCISPGSKGGAWKAKLYYLGGDAACAAAGKVFSTLPYGNGRQFSDPPTNSLPAN